MQIWQQPMIKLQFKSITKNAWKEQKLIFCSWNFIKIGTEFVLISKNCARKSIIFSLKTVKDSTRLKQAGSILGFTCHVSRLSRAWTK